MRSKRAWLAGAGVLCAGLFYGYVLIPAGLRLRCPIRMWTGLRCPGCGITDLCLGLMHGQFAPAHNWGLTAAAPAILWLVLTRRKDTAAFRRVLWITLGWMLLWGVLRNLYHL